jgi:hypothetical protein
MSVLCSELIILVKMMREGGDPLSCAESLYCMVIRLIWVACLCFGYSCWPLGGFAEFLPSWLVGFI